MAVLYRTVTLDEDLVKQVEAWANLPDQNRSFSNAVETLLKKAINLVENGGKDA